MKSAGITAEEFDKAVAEMAGRLVRAERTNGVWLVNLPMLYPDGSFVTVRLHQVSGGVRVSDAGFAYREADRVEASRSFRKIANRVAEHFDVQVQKKSICVLATEDELDGAVMDVAEASRRVAEQICQKVWDSEGDELPTALRDRLARIFGEDRLEESASIKGGSTSEWNMSAIVHLPGRDVVFQAVSDNGNSINKASTAFRDLSSLMAPPGLVAIVQSKDAIGARLSLLAPARVVEESQPDSFFEAAAAAA